MAFHKTLHHLRNRPRHEREAFARMTAFIVSGILFFGWAVFFFANLKSADFARAQSNLVNDKQATAAVNVAASQIQGEYASTTESLQELGVAAELEAQRDQDASQSATGTATDNAAEANFEDNIPDAASTSTYSQ